MWFHWIPEPSTSSFASASSFSLFFRLSQGDHRVTTAGSPASPAMRPLHLHRALRQSLVRWGRAFSVERMGTCAELGCGPNALSGHSKSGDVLGLTNEKKTLMGTSSLQSQFRAMTLPQTCSLPSTCCLAILIFFHLPGLEDWGPRRTRFFAISCSWHLHKGVSETFQLWQFQEGKDGYDVLQWMEWSSLVLYRQIQIHSGTQTWQLEIAIEVYNLGKSTINERFSSTFGSPRATHFLIPRNPGLPRLQQGRFGEAWGFSTRALLVHSSGRGRRIKGLGKGLMLPGPSRGGDVGDVAAMAGDLDWEDRHQHTINTSTYDIPLGSTCSL